MASSSSSGRSYTYDVFLNFRGEDTRKIFVGHLYRALKHRGLEPFIDSEDVGKGNDLSVLLKAIRESRLSIVVFSQNYASSTWCLKELVQILQCMDMQNQIVVPIFYQVDPSHVRKLKTSFAQAFAKYESDSKTAAEIEEVQTWKSALTRATNLSGWDSTKYEDDAKLIDEIVEHVFKEWMQISSSKNNNLVGMDFHLHKMRQLLRLEINDDFVKVGIWGMGGIGKTTIATEVYDEIRSQFAHCYFLPNVKEGFGNQERMQEQLLSGILKKEVRIDTLNDGYKIMKRLSEKKVLIVLDDVDNPHQIEALLGPEPSFGGGSRIIVTTRDSHILNGFERYEAELLSGGDAGKLFSQYAFKTNKPSGEYDHLSRHAVEYAQGLPLALKVLGSHLVDRSVSEWEEELDKIKKFPNSGIQTVLRTSYDGLDDLQKEIFLDVACFFKGMDVTNVFHSCDGFYPRPGLKVLVDRALVTITESGELQMHDLLQELGREIVRTESKEPGKRSRLWSYGDVERVLNENTATEAVEGLMNELPILGEIYFEAEAFDRMTNLRLLIFTSNMYNNGISHVNGDLKRLSRELRVLVWHSCPLKSLPSNFHPTNLIDLDMRHSHLEQLWQGIKPVKKLTFIDLRCCKYLKTIPNLTEATKLEKLDLEGCISLREIHPSIAGLTNLVFLSFEGCTELKILPSSIHLKSLKFLNLCGCSNLDKFPEISEDMEALSELKLDGTAIKGLPASIERLRRLESLSMENCTSLVCLPDSICNLVDLTCLYLSGCSKLDKFPEISGDMEALLELRLDKTAIKELPSSIERLRRLESLSMENCTSLVCFPDSICNLAGLTYLYLSGCSKLHNLPDNFGSLESLLELDLDESGIEQLPASILRLKLGRLSFYGCKQMVAPLSSWSSSIKGCCSAVVHIDLSDCNLLELSGAMAHFSSLKILKLSRTNLESLPAIMNQLVFLEQLELEGCKRLKSIPELSSRVSYINAPDCKALETISTPKPPYDMGRCFTFSNCSQLVQKDLFRDIVETHSPPKGNYSRPFYMCFPGSEIPERFIHQCRGSSVTAQLPPNWFDKKFLGFAICAVTNKPQAVDYYRLSARCFCTFKGDNCEYRFNFYSFDSYFDSHYCRWLESNHMFLGFIPWSEFGISGGEEVDQRYYTEAKFEIELRCKDDHVSTVVFDPCIERCDPCIERCGVQFFFANNEEVSHQDSERSLGGCSAEPSGSDITSDTSDDSDESDCEIEDNDSSGNRKILSRCTQQVGVTSDLMQKVLNDNFRWKPDGWQCIPDRRTGYLRYRCDHQPSCYEKSKMQISIDDPTILAMTYIGRRTCWETLPILTHHVRLAPHMGIEGPFDGFSWGKYGLMDILGAKYPRVYYVCTTQTVQGCMAIKEVQCCDDDPTILEISYRGWHTCTQASTISMGGRGALRIHDQVAQSPRSLGANGRGGNVIRQADRAVDDNNVNMLLDANSQDIEHFQNVNDMANNDIAVYGAASEGTSDTVVNQLVEGDLMDFNSLKKRKREMDFDDDQPNESNSISNNNP